MERHSLIHHIHRQQHLAHAIIARHTLAQHMRKHQSVLQTLGLRTKTTQPFSNPGIQSVRRLQPLVPFSSDSTLQTFPISDTHNEVELSSTQLISEPQDSIDTPISNVNHSPSEQGVETASIANTKDNIHHTPPAISVAPQETTSVISEQTISTPETLTTLTYQKTGQDNFQHIITDKSDQYPLLSVDIASNTATQQALQIDQSKGEPDAIKQLFDPSLLEQSAEVDRVVRDQRVQIQPSLSETLDVSKEVSQQNDTNVTNKENHKQIELDVKVLKPSSQLAQPPQDNQKPVAANMQEQRPRKRSRIEEQPQLSTSSYNQAIQLPEDTQPNNPKSKTPAIPPTNTEIKNNVEQPISDIDTPQTSKFSPQEWYARLVRAEQEAQLKQNRQAVTPTIPQQAIPSVEPTKELTTPDEQFSAITNQPINDTTPIKNTPFTEKATNRVTNIANALPTPTTSTPLSQRARRFLRPLVGIDPASVHIYSGRQAEQLTTAYKADAITVGNNVAIAAGHLDDTAETLGLLAHELTHVVRQREPRFIPPIVRPASALTTRANQLSRPGVDTPGNAKINSPSTSTIRYNTSALEDEEALAQQVEARVTRAAKNVVNQNAIANNLWSGPTGLTDMQIAKPVAPMEAEGTSNTAGKAWGGLPAPWEPLPDWLVGGEQGDVPYSQASTTPIQTTQWHDVTGKTDSAKANISEPAPIGVQRAGKERSVIDDEVNSSSSQQATTMGTVPNGNQQELEPDLDDLARQVYTRLKYRLGVENRRERL